MNPAQTLDNFFDIFFMAAALKVHRDFEFESLRFYLTSFARHRNRKERTNQLSDGLFSLQINL